MVGLQITSCHVACHQWPDGLRLQSPDRSRRGRSVAEASAANTSRGGWPLHRVLRGALKEGGGKDDACRGHDLIRPDQVWGRRAGSIARLGRRVRCGAEEGGDISGRGQPEQGASPVDTATGAVAVGTEGMPDGAELAEPGADVDQPPVTRRPQGLAISTFLFLVLLAELLLVDSYIWRVVRRPLASFFLTLPFLLSTVFSGYLGCLAVPILRRIKAHQVIREEGPQGHMAKSGTPTMGGLFFIPVGVGIARLTNEFASRELWGVGAATLGFAAIGLLDDGLILLRKSNTGLPGTIKFLLQLALGTWFFFWLSGAGLASPYNMNWLVPLPPPLGLLYIGGLYLPLSVFVFAAMSNGVNLTDGLDGLAAGTCAAAFVGMAVACLPIYPSLGVFGASMAGACVGFLAHNCHKASVFMGDTGSLALGGALAAMAACTGMFMPLLIASGVFVVETISVILQVAVFKSTKRVTGTGRRLFLMAPFHHHLELCGLSEPQIIIVAYSISIVLAIIAAHIGLISA